MLRLALSSTLLAVFLGACGGGSSPEGVYRRYLEAAARGDAEAALVLMDESSIDRLMGLVAKETSRSPEVLEPDDAGARLRGAADPAEALRRLWALDGAGGASATTPAFAEKVEVRRADVAGDEAVLEIACVGHVAQVLLRRTRGKWFVVLGGIAATESR